MPLRRAAIIVERQPLLSAAVLVPTDVAFIAIPEPISADRRDRLSTKLHQASEPAKPQIKFTDAAPSCPTGAGYSADTGYRHRPDDRAGFDNARIARVDGANFGGSKRASRHQSTVRPPLCSI